MSHRYTQELAERGTEVDHVTVYRCVQRFTLLIDEPSTSNHRCRATHPHLIAILESLKSIRLSATTSHDRPCTAERIDWSTVFEHSSTLESIDFGQDPAFEVGTGTETHGDHLRRTGHLSTSTLRLPRSLPAWESPALGR